MKTLDISKVKLPLSRKKFIKLRKAIRTGRIKWMDMSNDLIYAYQDYWRYKKFNKVDETL